jgi:hypothetical protein
MIVPHPAFLFPRETLQRGLAAVRFANVLGFQGFLGLKDHKLGRCRSVITLLSLMCLASVWVGLS